jgi:hypothetical protein
LYHTHALAFIKYNNEYIIISHSNIPNNLTIPYGYNYIPKVEEEKKEEDPTKIIEPKTIEEFIHNYNINVGSFIKNLYLGTMYSPVNTENVDFAMYKNLYSNSDFLINLNKIIHLGGIKDLTFNDPDKNIISKMDYFPIRSIIKEPALFISPDLQHGGVDGTVYSLKYRPYYSSYEYGKQMEYNYWINGYSKNKTPGELDPIHIHVKGHSPQGPFPSVKNNNKTTVICLDVSKTEFPKESAMKSPDRSFAFLRIGFGGTKHILGRFKLPNNLSTIPNIAETELKTIPFVLNTDADNQKTIKTNDEFAYNIDIADDKESFIKTTKKFENESFIVSHFIKIGKMRITFVYWNNKSYRYYQTAVNEPFEFIKSEAAATIEGGAKQYVNSIKYFSKYMKYRNKNMKILK